VTTSQPNQHPITPDGRYFVVNGRLWRMSRPDLPDDEREQLVRRLMTARRDVRTAKRGDDETSLKDARLRVDDAKRALGERGPVWWTDGAPDLNRRMVINTPYRGWFEALSLQG
jgi:hypothetical protein